MDLDMLSLGILIPEGPWCVFYAMQGIKLTEVWHIMCLFCWYSDLILHTETHTHTKRYTTHSGANRLTHPYKYLFTPVV